MQRVAVIGSSGAGKSTFARALAARTGLPLHALDRYYWKPGWVEPTTEEWRETNRRLVAEPRWILDGNYGGTMDIRLPAADTVIIIGLPRTRCLLAATTRTIKNRGTSSQAEGCPERMTWEFARYIWAFPNEGRVRLDKRVAAHGAHLRILECTTRRDAQALLDRVTRSKR